jgi:phage terminase Nu1 subunit (DNA packaging protein)
MTRKPPRSAADLLGDDEPPPQPKIGRPLVDHTQRLKLAQAEHAELKNRALKGELLSRGAVVAEWQSILREVRAGVLAAPSRIRSKLPRLSQHDVATIDEVLRAILADLAPNTPAKAAGEPPQADS